LLFVNYTQLSATPEITI